MNDFVALGLTPGGVTIVFGVKWDRLLLLQRKMAPVSWEDIIIAVLIFPPHLNFGCLLKSFKSVMWSNSVRCSSSVTSNITFVLRTEVQSFYINLNDTVLTCFDFCVCCASVLCFKGCSLHPDFLYYAKVELVHFKSYVENRALGRWNRKSLSCSLNTKWKLPH